MARSPADKALLSRMSEMVRLSRTALWETDKEAMQSIAYALANQYSKIHPERGAYLPDGIPASARLVSFPIIPRAVDGAVSRLASTKPIWDAVAIRATQKAMRSAQKTRLSLRWVWQDNNMPYQILEALWWMNVTPRVYFKCSFDPRGGRATTRPRLDPQSGQPITDPVTGVALEEACYEGRIKIEVCNWFEITRDPLASWEGNARWIDHAKLITCDEVEELFPGNRPAAEPYEPSNRFWRSSIIQALRHPFSNFSATLQASSPREEKCVLHETQFLPSKDFPKGVIMTWAGDKIVDLKDPSPYDDLTYSGISERITGGAGGGDYRAHRGISGQDVINGMASQMWEHCGKASNPFLVRYAGDSALGPMTGAVGQEVVADSTHPRGPHWEQPGQLGQEVVELLKIAGEMLKVVMEVDTLSSQVSGGASGRARQTALEADDMTMGQTREALAFALKRTGRQARKLFRKLVGTIPVCVYGETRADDMRDDITSSDFEEECDVVVSLQSSASLSRAARAEEIEMLLKATPNPSPEQMEAAAAELAEGAMEEAYRQSSIDESFAQRQIRRISRTMVPEQVEQIPGQPGPPDAMGMPTPGKPLVHENLQVTEEAFSRCLHSDEFEALPPQAQEAIRQTWAWKRALLDQQKAEAAQARMQLALADKGVQGMTSGGAGRDAPPSPVARSPLTNLPENVLV